MRRHPTYADVAATLALVIALGSGTALAATVITSADIKNGTIKTKDLSAQAVKALKGNKGDQGPAGPKGDRGLSSWDAIPSGTTVLGYERFDVESSRANSDFQFAIHLPGVAPVALAADTVNFAPDANASDDDATCTGTSAAPTAPAGKMCLYMVASTGSSSFAGTDTNTAFGSRRAGRVYWTGVPADSDTFVEFSWAYTAP